MQTLENLKNKDFNFWQTLESEKTEVLRYFALEHFNPAARAICERVYENGDKYVYYRCYVGHIFSAIVMVWFTLNTKVVSRPTLFESVLSCGAFALQYFALVEYNYTLTNTYPYKLMTQLEGTWGLIAFKMGVIAVFSILAFTGSRLMNA